MPALPALPYIPSALSASRCPAMPCPSASRCLPERHPSACPSDACPSAALSAWCASLPAFASVLTRSNSCSRYRIRARASAAVLLPLSLLSRSTCDCSRRTSAAAVYPPGLCRAVLRGAQAQWEADHGGAPAPVLAALDSGVGVFDLGISDADVCHRMLSTVSSPGPAAGEAPEEVLVASDALSSEVMDEGEALRAHGGREDDVGRSSFLSQWLRSTKTCNASALANERS